MSVGKKILAVVLSAILLVVGSGAVYLFNIRSSISGASIDDNAVSVNKYLNHDVINLALFGVDGRPDVEGNRSDTIMIISINFKTGKAVLTSIQRDTIARIPKNSTIKKDSYTKINAAYSYGGPELAVKTINENYDLNITDYVTISFQCMIDAVNTVGGVTINIKDDSILKYTNKYINDYNRLNNTQAKTLTHTGKNHLNGIQALAYSRNRYSDNDFGRTERQREVFNKVFNKLTKLSSLKLANLVTKIYPNIRTSMSTTELSTMLRGYMQLDSKKLTNQHVPFDNYYAFVTYEGSSIAPKTLVDNVIQLHQAIYGTEKSYTPSDTVNEISDGIVRRTGVGTLTGTTSADSSTGSSSTSTYSSGSSSSTSSRSTRSYSSNYSTKRTTTTTSPSTSSSTNSTSPTTTPSENSPQTTPKSSESSPSTGTTTE
ncbi:LCP family protein [uncultured Pseudoramibacter sp.]|uniref:LCP family protein n=1 Tax=uncultured Pseudoramibacter sp. TaxID=1623493 RepID=UPI0025D9FA6D|nr:LCP family protein [uncultured Pseudoramibacter sp.]